ncbi:hypothetical protein GCM10009665_16750 [Kitasatospora nipponensis]|uniref:Transposase n=1 Tax=Kitasatospora nipponensis TaxID=258049 RepID=A0ABN1VXW6_9ACTN
MDRPTEAWVVGDRRRPEHRQGLRPPEGTHRRPPRTPLRPENLRDKDIALLRELTTACPEMAALARLTGEFAQLLTPAQDTTPSSPSGSRQFALSTCPPVLLTTRHHSGRTEDVNIRTKRIMRQMHGRAGFDLIRHRILLQ